MKTVVLNPGDFFFGERHERIRTLLGSCIAITLWHPKRQVGGMCHYLLPSSGKPRLEQLDGRYADQAMALFLQGIRRTRTEPKEYQVKIFGGGNMFPGTASRGEVGERNIIAARQLLEQNGFRRAEEHVGEHGHRTVILDLASGETWLRWQYGKVVL